VLEHRGRRVYHAGDSAYFDGFQDIGERMKPELSLLPIGAYYPDSFRRVHMGPDEAMKAFRDLAAQWFVPMHFGTFKLSFESMEEPAAWLRRLALEAGLGERVRFLEEGVPEQF
jgi:L-ascorbate metabolism protein UlaG (beta-lactamase superfamily)